MNQPDTWEKRFDKLRDPDDCMHEEKKNYVKKLLTTTKANWLRSEIEKWEKYLDGLYKHRGNIPMPTEVTTDIYRIGFNEGWNSGVDVVINQDLTSIITRYKEELKVLESK